jgi:hypothetical protein
VHLGRRTERERASAEGARRGEGEREGKAVLEGHSNLSDHLVSRYALFIMITPKYYELFTNALLH